ncbi:MAG: HvfC/BufC family peptide modification chaperone, partial [Burkholderiales bacterium]
MSALARLQHMFQRRVFRPHARFEREVVSTTRLAARERLEIYSSAYRARLVGALAKDYPGLKALLGNQGFERIALAYVEAHPSRFANLRWYGGGLAAFLRKSGPRRSRRALAEMAAFEWSVGLAFDAADDPALEVSAVSARAPAAWPRMRFSPHPSVRRLDLHFNVPALRAATDAGKPLPRLRRRRGPV